MKSFQVILVLALSIVIYTQETFTTPFAVGYTPPTQIHWAVCPNPTDLIFSWHTSLPTEDSYVVLTEQGKTPLKFHGSQKTYLASAGWLHTVNATGLTPSTNYTYIVGSSVGESAVFKLTTSPPIGTKGNYTFIMYGDMGIFEYAFPTVYHVTQLVQAGEVDLIYHAGDMGYGDDRKAPMYEVSWNLFMEQMQIAMEYVPYMTCVGNHEYHCGHDPCNFYSSNYTTYNYRFNNMPGYQSGSNTTMWFSFNYANVHFVSISTETDFPGSPEKVPFGDQVGWLERDLQIANNNTDIDWIIVVGHRPIYSSFDEYSVLGEPVGDSFFLQRAFEDLFKQYNVDIFFNGHVHGYERTYPVYKSKVSQTYGFNQYVNPDATVYITSGSAGNIEGFDSANVGPVPHWSANRNWPDPTHGYGVIQIYGSNELRFSQYLNTLSPEVDNNYFDWFVITRTETSNPPVPPPPSLFE